MLHRVWNLHRVVFQKWYDVLKNYNTRDKIYFGNDNETSIYGISMEVNGVTLGPVQWWLTVCMSA